MRIRVDIHMGTYLSTMARQPLSSPAALRRFASFIFGCKHDERAEEIEKPHDRPQYCHTGIIPFPRRAFRVRRPAYFFYDTANRANTQTVLPRSMASVLLCC
jgi:hypothetical protein